MGQPVLGIDLGTTNSVAAIADEDGARILHQAGGVALIPSIVSFHPSGDILVGKPAKDRRLVDAANTIYSVKRLIGRPFNSPEVSQAGARFAFDFAEGPSGGVMVNARGGTYALSEISAFVLREVRRTAEEALGYACSRAVVTVPANFNELQRSATKAAGRIAGLDVLRILNEPTAAALAYGYERTANERIAVYDLGGGTFDITILQLDGNVFEVLGTAGDTFLGGDDIDVLIANDMANVFLKQTRYDVREDRQVFERLRAAAEWAKCELSRKKRTKLVMEELAYGAGGAALNLNYQLTREKLVQLAQPLIARTFDACEDAMRTAGVRPTQLDAVILVGGSTRMLLVQNMVHEYFGKKPRIEIDPDLVVAQGAAIQAYALSDMPGRAELGRVALKRVAQPTKRPDAFEELSTNPEAHIDHSLSPQLSDKVERPALGEPSDWEADTEVTFDSVAPPSAPNTPLLLDVTPLSLGVETVSGYCEHIIPRNSAIPTEETKLFTTGRDFQESVEVRICQGESRELDSNQMLGKITLNGLRKAQRGVVEISVTFVIDANGTLQVLAKDKETGVRQEVAIRLIGEMPREELERIEARHQEFFEK